jgi:hypothetical protein
VTSLWLILHDPATFRRTALARWMTAQRGRSKLIRPLRPALNNAKSSERIEPDHAQHRQMHEREWEIAASYLSRPQAVPFNTDHHDFASRLRDR